MESIEKVFNSCYKYIQGFKGNKQNEKLDFYKNNQI